MTDLVELGQVGVYPEVQESVLGTDPIGQEVLTAMLDSFGAGKWGAVPEHIWQANDDHVLMGGLVVGVYPLQDELGLLLDMLAAATDSPPAPTVCIVTMMGSGQTVMLSADELTSRIEGLMEQQNEQED